MVIFSHGKRTTARERKAKLDKISSWKKNCVRSVEVASHFLPPHLSPRDTPLTTRLFFLQDSRIRHTLHDVCLDVSEGSNLVVRKCDGRDTQKWRFSAYPEKERTQNIHVNVL